MSFQFASAQNAALVDLEILRSLHLPSISHSEIAGVGYGVYTEAELAKISARAHDLGRCGNF